MITSEDIQTVANSVTTVGQARAVLGAESIQLKEGYSLIEQIGGPGSTDARQAASDLLDQANAYAQGIYATLPKEADSWVLDESWRRRVAGAMLTGFAAVDRVAEEVKELSPDYAAEYLAALRESIGGVTSAIGTVVATVASGIGFWPIAIAVGVILVAIYVSSRGRAAVGA